MCSKIQSTLYVCVLLTFLIVTSLLTSAQVTVFATGLNNPRGIKFGPDGLLYVAEGGLGGSRSTVGQCDQVIEPVGLATSRLAFRKSARPENV